MSHYTKFEREIATPVLHTQAEPQSLRRWICSGSPGLWRSLTHRGPRVPTVCVLLSQAPRCVATLFSPPPIPIRNPTSQHLSSTIVWVLDTTFKMTANALMKLSSTSWITFFGERVMNSCNSWHIMINCPPWEFVQIHTVKSHVWR